MTDAIKLNWLADWFDSNDTPGDGDEVQKDLRRIASRIESLEGELDRRSIHTCSEKCPRLECVQRREIERLKKAIKEHRLDTGDYWTERDQELWAALEVDDE